MKYIKKFESFRMAEPATKPAPTTTPTPTERPSRPSPIRRDRPSVSPDPLAKKKATEEAISNRFIELADAKGIDIKKYYN